MLFKTHQALTLAGITNDKLRHWKTHLRLLRFDGRKGGFDFDQIVALAVINRVVSTLKVPIAAIAPHAEHVFSAVASFLRTGSPAVLWIGERGVLTDAAREAIDADVIIHVHIKLIADDVRAAAISVQDDQLDFLLPPGQQFVERGSPQTTG